MWFSKLKPILGVDIGTSSVKVVQIKSIGKSQYVLEKIGIAPIRYESKGDRSEISDVALTEAVRNAITESGTTLKDVCSSIAGESVIVRYLQFPEMSDPELDSTVRFQAEEYIPFRLDEVNLDFHRLDSSSADGGGKKIDVLLVAVRNDLVSHRAELLRSIGLNPAIMDVDSFALLNCMENNYEFQPDEVLALVCIGASTTNINIFSNKVTRFSRDISLGGNTVTKSIATKLNVSFDEAEKSKIDEGIIFSKETTSPNPDTSGVAEAIKETVEKITGEKMDAEDRKSKLAAAIRQPIQNLITEIRRSLQFFENQPNGKPVTKVLLTGGGSKLRNLDRYMNERLGLPVEIVNPLKKIDTSLIKTSYNLQEMAPQLAVVIGLGIRKQGDR